MRFFDAGEADVKPLKLARKLMVIDTEKRENAYRGRDDERWIYQDPGAGAKVGRGF